MAKSETYEEFIAKFKIVKKTTDDCYTPESIYRAVLDWTVKRYDLGEDVRIVRPFYPGGDYRNEDYSGDCVVVDNPPFSILKSICEWYQRHDIRFLLFCQGLTVFELLNGGGDGYDNGLCQILPEYRITYSNGANINTSFITNMDPNRIVIQGDLHDILARVKNDAKTRRVKAKPKYPPNLVTSQSLGKYATRGMCIDIPDQVFLHNDKGLICGGGMVLSDRAISELHTLWDEYEQGRFDAIMPQYNAALARQNSNGKTVTIRKKTTLDDFL